MDGWIPNQYFCVYFMMTTTTTTTTTMTSCSALTQKKGEISFSHSHSRAQFWYEMLVCNIELNWLCVVLGQRERTGNRFYVRYLGERTHTQPTNHSTHTHMHMGRELTIAIDYERMWVLVNASQSLLLLLYAWVRYGMVNGHHHAQIYGDKHTRMVDCQNKIIKFYRFDFRLIIKSVSHTIWHYFGILMSWKRFESVFHFMWHSSKWASNLHKIAQMQ